MNSKLKCKKVEEKINKTNRIFAQFKKPWHFLAFIDFICSSIKQFFDPKARKCISELSSWHHIVDEISWASLRLWGFVHIHFMTPGDCDYFYQALNGMFIFFIYFYFLPHISKAPKFLCVRVKLIFYFYSLLQRKQNSSHKI